MHTPRKIYERRSVETEPLKRKIMVHSVMYYKCKDCGTTFQFWLEKGLEDKKQDEIDPKNHKPVPFCIGCLCGGIAQHFAWGSDIRLDDYRPLKEDENYFENTEKEDCGISHFRNEGEGMIKAIRNAIKFVEEECENAKAEREVCEEDFEDDPYGLAHISTTTLKAELRRRKDWKQRRR